MLIRSLHAMTDNYRSAAMSGLRRSPSRPAYIPPRQYKQKPKPEPEKCPNWHVDPTAPLLVEINRFLDHFNMPPSRFGHYHHDKRLVFDLVNGRKPRERVEARIWAFMAKFEG